VARVIVTAPTILEDNLRAEGYSIVAGVDEAGRGPLAGPVVACAVVLPPGLIIEGVNDSKKLSEKRREELAEKIKAAAVAFAYGIIGAAKIDEINILRATMLAMEIAVKSLDVAPNAVLVDGNQMPNLAQHAVCVTKGDANSHLIAAASILAKTKRDEMMLDLHEKYPEYGFDRHKGYGTVMHKQALEKFGPCPEHRKTFI